MSRDYKLYLEDIIESIDKIKQYMVSMDYGAFTADGRTVDAVIRNLEIIGEAAKNIPENILSMENSIDWKKIKGMRDILTHNYFGISLIIVWDVVHNKLDDLRHACEKLLQELS